MIVDLFAGPGGWSEGLRMLGLRDIGVEWDASACATRAAAGHRTIRADVAQVPTGPFVGKVSGLIASPPCQAFSAAGARKGADLLPELCAAVRARDWSARPDPDPKVWLVLDVGRWIKALRPWWIALEQVKEVLPIWQEYAAFLRELGYSAQTAVVDAANYGVPQNRKRAVLVASRLGSALLPPPTHADNPATLFGETSGWVSMRDAIGWGYDHRGAPTVTCGGTATGGSEPFGHAARRALARYVVSTGDHSYKHSRDKVDAVDYERTIDRPSPTVLGAKFEGAWFVHEEGRRDEAIAGEVPSIRLTLDEAAALQTFPSGYPFQGTKGKRAEQIGNAVPPLLAARILAAVTGIELREAA